MEVWRDVQAQKDALYEVVLVKDKVSSVAKSCLKKHWK